MKRTDANVDTKGRTGEATDAAQQEGNVLNFSTTLRELRKNVDRTLLRHREGWRDKNGNIKTIEYIEWHTVADILDEIAPNWAHTVKDIRSIGDFMTVTVAITIDGVTREGIGTGSARSEMGIKKAEHDALKRAAVKFGIARDLYKREFDAIYNPGKPMMESGGNLANDTIARSISEMITPRQIGMIHTISRERGIDAEAECKKRMDCRVTELSRRAASQLIDCLSEMPPVRERVRRVG